MRYRGPFYWYVIVQGNYLDRKSKIDDFRSRKPDQVRKNMISEQGVLRISCKAHHVSNFGSKGAPQLLWNKHIS